MRLFRFPWLAAFLLSGCVVHEARPLPPPMSDAEAVQRGETWCSSHGWGCRPRRVGRHGDVVEVVFDAQGHGVEGPLRLEFGSWDRRLVRVEVPAVGAAGPRGEVGLTHDAFSRTLLGVRESVQGS